MKPPWPRWYKPAEYPTLARVIHTVAAHFGITALDLKSDRKARIVSHPRHLAMLLCKELTPASLPAIGAALRKDTCTIKQGIETARSRIIDGEEWAAHYDAIRSKLGAQAI